MELACKYQSPGWEGAEHIALHMESSVRAIADYGFEAVKFDGSPASSATSRWWAALLNATGVPMTIENCHGPPFPHMAKRHDARRGRRRRLLGHDDAVRLPVLAVPHVDRHQPGLGVGARQPALAAAIPARPAAEPAGRVGAPRHAGGRQDGDGG